MFKQAFTFEKLLIAHKKCRVSKQHKRQTISFELNLSQNISKIEKAIFSKTWNVGDYKQFFIYEPKKRNIEALSYKDRVVLMSLCSNIIEPVFEKLLIFDNVACRKGKGTLFGIKRLEYFLHKYKNKYKTNKGYYLKCDISKYFPSINHAVLKDLLSKTSLDDEDLWIINKIIDSKYAETGVGLPIGNQTSQWFGLFYLNTLDRFIKEKLRIKYYVRYMDDMVLIHNDKEYLKECKTKIQQFVQEKLKLSLNSKTQIGLLKDGIDFLGFNHKLNENGQVIRFLRQSAKIRLKKHIKNLRNLRDKGIINDNDCEIRLQAYEGYLRHSNTHKLLYNIKKKYGFK